MSKQDAEDMLEQLGNNVRMMREAQGLSLRKLALMSGVNFSRLWSIEQGRDNPTVMTLHKLATSLDVPIASLFYGA